MSELIKGNKNDLERAKAILGEMIENRRYFHQHPETGMELSNTVAYVMERLKEMGIEPQHCGGGVTALIGGKKEGPVFLLRADMDALPMAEESGLPFASTIDKAHTCGHDMHTAMLLGAAKLLKEEEDTLPGTVKLMFQPAEETLEGAKAMLADGILESPKVDGAMGVHMAPVIPCGIVGYSKGVVNTSSDCFTISINGKGGHGASPHNSIDPINVGVHIYLALQELVAREVDPADHVALTIGLFQAGNADNIIPDTAKLGGTLRTINEETRKRMLERIRQVTDLTAKTFRSSAQLEISGATCALVLDSEGVDSVDGALKEVFGRGAMLANTRMAGSEDFAEVSVRVPSIFLAIGGADPEEKEHFGGHHPKVRFDERSLAYGAAGYVCCAKAWLAAHQR